METDAQGRGLEHYARDSWRMSEREKTEIEANKTHQAYFNYYPIPTV